MKLALVTATLNWNRALPCVQSWRTAATGSPVLYTVVQGMGHADWVRREGHYLYMSREILGVVPAFALGVQRALEDGAEIIAALHDDLEIEQEGWDQDVIRLFKACPRAGLLGFGGAKGLGSDDLYKIPYHPMQLARQGFRSNMRHAEAHGIRSEVVERVACLDGFAQVGRREFWLGFQTPISRGKHENLEVTSETGWNLFSQMQLHGIVHHWYDGALGAYAKRLGWQVWYLPIACHHHGGVTAVADPRYQDWAHLQHPDGDAHFWEASHRIGYDQFRDVLPIRT